MTYNLARTALDNIISQLDVIGDRLATGEPAVIKSHVPHKDAYKIREALAAARAHQVKPYCDWKLKISCQEKVMIITGKHVPTVEVVKRTPGVLVPDARSTFDVVAYFKSNDVKPDMKYVFPDYSDAPTMLESWLKRRGLSYSLNPLTIWSA